MADKEKGDFLHINALKSLYDAQVKKRVIVNVDTTEKQFLFDVSHTLLRIEEALNAINMKIEKEKGLNMVKPMNEEELRREKAVSENNQQKEKTMTQAVEPAVIPPEDITANQPADMPASEDIPTSTMAVPKADTEIAEEIEPAEMPKKKAGRSRKKEE